MKWFKKETNINIKLVAIAKDEAAYIPEWIFHHLKMGFDSIDIYINNTSDNSWELAKCFSDIESVNFIDGDEFFYEGNENPQLTTYRHAYKALDKSAFSHLMFLDIDEFFYCKGKFVDIKSCLKALNYPEILCLNWFNVYYEKEFSSVYQSTLTGETSRWVKTIFSTSVKVNHVEIHNVKTKENVYFLGDGTKWEFQKDGTPAAYCDGKYVAKTAKDTFVLHRMYRSELEYVSMLSKGTADQNSKDMSILRKNRHGFCIYPGATEKIAYQQHECESLNVEFEEFIKTHQLEGELKKAIGFVKQRYQTTLNNIKTSPLSDLDKINKITKNVELPDVKAAYQAFLQNVMKDKKNEIADTLRNLAVSVEKIDLSTAEHLMGMALHYKPNGPMIKKKLETYQKSIASKKTPM